ncbi:MAG: hypothetical protein HYU39_04870 [Thaumarchaeota archaeon]|nr:hypothetical protein [Nitrososphaerota archaeon]
MEASSTPNKAYEESILEGMNNTLGKGGTQALLFHLQLIQYANNPRQFHNNLYSILGPGAITLEKVIVKELFNRLNMRYDDRNDFDFEKHMDLARHIIATRLQEAEQ